MWSLAMTYFRTRKCTIIGAVSFHGPVREGKGWVRNAMVAKRNWYVCRGLAANARRGEGCCCGCGELLRCSKVIGSSRTGN